VSAVTARLSDLKEAAKTGATVTLLTPEGRALTGTITEHATEPDTFVFRDVFAQRIAAMLDALAVEEVLFE
jgi:pyruvoyl-dependent arginine decarboxylase (PvlArgDC)